VSAVRSRYHRNGVDCALVNCTVCELVKSLHNYLLLCGVTKVQYICLPFQISYIDFQARDNMEHTMRALTIGYEIITK
jgi:hypothetical protein